jgi:periplasmic protein TonB
MLEDSTFESARQTATRKPESIIYSLLLHSAATGLLVLIPLLQMQAVPIPRLDSALPAPQFVREHEIDITLSKDIPQLQLEVDPGAVITPQFIPQEITRVIDTPSSNLVNLPGTGNERGIASILHAVIDRLEEVPSPPVEPPPQAVEPEASPIRVSAGVQEGSLIHRVIPVYPATAKIARIEGVVVLEAVISKEGMVNSLRIISGHPLLTQAAIDAVRQWIYRPTLLSLEPVAVVTTITVTFSLR